MLRRTLPDPQETGVTMEEGHSVWIAQRALRAALIDTATGISHAPARDLAAHMLLFLEDGERVWEIARSWLRKWTEVDVAQGGFVTPHDTHFFCTGRLESSGGEIGGRVEVRNCEPALQRMWRNGEPLQLPSIADAAGMSAGLRRAFLDTGTRAKMMSRLHDGRSAFGLVSLSQGKENGGWRPWQVDLFQSVVREVLTPVLAVVKDLETDRQTSPLGALTVAEARVARLAAIGLSYKEIARHLGRSPHTVDHQLRQIRHKLGIATHSRLALFLSSGGAIPTAPGSRGHRAAG